ncbi:MAG: HAD family phosphatase [Spirochaetota bacterium]
MRAIDWKPGAALFDLDGTLVDTEPLFELSEVALLADWGIELDEALIHKLYGQSALGFFRIMEAHFPDNALFKVPLAERLAAKTRAYRQVAQGQIRVFPRMEAFARDLAARGVPLALASSSTHEIIDFELSETGMAGLFPVRVSAADVAQGKPEPDVFIEAARRLGADLGECAIFEDSFLGFRAAQAAGGFVIALPAPSADLSRFASADFLVAGGSAAFNASLLPFPGWRL